MATSVEISGCGLIKNIDGKVAPLTNIVFDRLEKIAVPIIEAITVFFRMSGLELCSGCVHESVRGMLLGDSFVTILRNQRSYLVPHGKKCKTSPTTIILIYLIKQMASKTLCCAKHSFQMFRWGTKTEECVAEAQSASFLFDELICTARLLCPGIAISRDDFKRASDFCRGFGTIYTGVEKMLLLVSRLLDLAIDKASVMLEIKPEEVTCWLQDVDKILVLYETTEGEYITQKDSMTFFSKYRKDVYKLYTKGKVLMRKFVYSFRKDGFYGQIEKKVTKLEKLISESSSLYIGNDKKEKPLLLYLWGSPGVGKTVSVDHIFTDLFSLLNRPDYNPATDKYCYNSMSAYFDTYAHQSVFEVSDFLQMRDKNVQMQEIVNILKCGDESSFPLNMADCPSKGTTFFTSEFIVCTSNVNPHANKTTFSSIMAEPEAFIRRIDVVAQVSREPDASVGYNKDSMIFSIGGLRYSYNEFIVFLYKKYRDQVAKSAMVTDARAAFDLERIDDMKIMLASASNTIINYPSNYRNVQVFGSSTCVCSIPDCRQCKNFFSNHSVSAGEWHPVNTKHRSWKCASGDFHMCRKECAVLVEAQCGSAFDDIYNLEFNFDVPTLNQKVEIIKQLIEPVAENHGIQIQVYAFNRHYVYGSGPLYNLVISKSKVLSFSPVCEADFDLYEKAYNLTVPFSSLPDPLERYKVNLSLVQDVLDKFSSKYKVYVVCQYLDTKLVSGSTTNFHYLMKILRNRVVYFQPLLSADSQNGTSIWYGLDGTTRIRWGDLTEFEVYEEGTRRSISKIQFIGYYLNYLRDKLLKKLANIPSPRTIYRKTVDLFKKTIVYIVSPFVHVFTEDTFKNFQEQAYKFFKILIKATLAVVGAGILFQGLKPVLKACGQTETSAELPTTRRTVQVKGPRARFQQHKVSAVTVGGQAVDPGEILGELAPGNANLLMHNIRPNIGILTSMRGNVNVIGLCDHKIAFVEHAVSQNTEMLTAVFPGGLSFHFSLSQVHHVLCSDNHLYLVDLGSIKENRQRRSFSNIVRYFINEQNDDFEYDGFVFGAVNLSSVLTHIVKMATNIKYSAHPVKIQVKNMSSMYIAEDCISYDAYTLPGDCTAPVIANHNDRLVIVGLHCARQQNGRCYAGYVTQEWMLNALSSLNAEGQINPKLEDYPTPVEYLGSEPPAMFMSRKSQLVKSPYWTPQNSKSPSPLKGDFNGRTPLEISMHKSLRKIVVPDPVVFSDEREWLGKIYRSSGPKEILTLEQAIFGDEALGISSVSGKASVGHPWNTFTTRKQLIDLTKKTIHPSLSEAVNILIEKLRNGTEPEFLVVDLLKDEKLPLNKVALGKSRIFCVLPIDVNLVLKMYFGQFLQHVMDLHNTHPVKIGMSLSAKDSACLATNLFSNRQDVSYLAGDFAASDRCIPFEIFMVLIQFVNEWYRDGYSEHRYLLGRAVFQPVHDCDGLRYKTRQGMPSGLYLTSVFNSLAYALIFKKVFNTLNCPLLSISTYGDDHVLVVPKEQTPTVEVVSRELEIYGLTYTGSDKKGLPSWISFEQVDFLQRKLVFDSGIWYFRMPIKTIVDNMGYYRRTAETRNWSEKRIIESISINGFYEFFQHGRKVFDLMLKEYDHILKTVQIPTYGHILYNYVNGTITPLALEFTSDPSFGYPRDSDIFEVAVGQANPSTDQTQIGDVEKVTRKENLTGFVELEATQPVISPPGLPALDSSFEWGADYSRSLERFFLIDTITLDNSDPSSTPFYRINPVLKLLNEPYIRQRLFQARGVRFDLEIEVRVIATKFHYGQIMGVFRPAIAQNQICVYFNSGAFTQWEWGPYDHISTASQCKHHIIPITQGPPVSFDCKWHYPYNWVNVDCEANTLATTTTGENMSEICKFALFDLYKTTPIQPSDLDKPQLLVWGRFKNVRLFGYVGQTDHTFNNLTSVWPTPIAWGQIDNLLNDCKSLEEILDEMEQNNELTLFTEIALKYLIDKYDGPIAQGQSEESQMGKSWLTKPLNLARSIGSVVSHVTDFLPGLATIGLSHPRKDKGPELMNVGVYNTSTSVGLSNALTLSYRSDDAQTNLKMSSESKDIDFLGARPTFIGWKTFTNSDTSIFYSVSHGMLNNFSGGNVYTPAGYLTRFFKFSRSAVKLYFHFSASAMVAARVTIMATPVVTDVNLNYLKVTHTIDITGDMLEELDLPYLEQFAYNEDGPLWNITIKTVSAIVSPEAANTRPILLAFWVAFPGLELGVNSLASDSTLEIPRLTIAVGQIDSSPSMQGTLSDPNSHGYGLTSAPISLYHLMKRMNGYYDHLSLEVLSYRPARPYFPTAGYAIHAPIWYYIIVLYKYIHGGFETLLDSEPTVSDTQAVSTQQNAAPMVEPTHITPAQFSLCGGVLSSAISKPYFVIPYRAKTPYTFVEYPLYGFHGHETYRRTSIPSRIVQAPVTIKAQTVSSWPADDFEMFLWVGTPVVRISTT